MSGRIELVRNSLCDASREMYCFVLEERLLELICDEEKGIVCKRLSSHFREIIKIQFFLITQTYILIKIRRGSFNSHEAVL